MCYRCDKVLLPFSPVGGKRSLVSMRPGATEPCSWLLLPKELWPLSPAFPTNSVIFWHYHYHDICHDVIKVWKHCPRGKFYLLWIIEVRDRRMVGKKSNSGILRLIEVTQWRVMEDNGMEWIIKGLLSTEKWNSYNLELVLRAGSHLLTVTALRKHGFIKAFGRILMISLLIIEI